MFGRLLATFLIILLIEIAVLIKIGQYIGVWPTLVMVVGLGFIGFILTRMQGVYVIYQVQSNLARGEIPGDALLDGALVLAGGVALITPGVITAFIGLALMFPLIRLPVRNFIKVWLAKQIYSGKWHIQLRRW